MIIEEEIEEENNEPDEKDEWDLSQYEEDEN